MSLLTALLLLLQFRLMNPLQNSFRNICNWSDATMMASDPVPSSMDPNTAAPSHLDMINSHQSEDAMKGMVGASAGGHIMLANDPDNPQNWPLYKKIYVSSVAFAFSWVVYVIVSRLHAWDIANADSGPSVLPLILRAYPAL